MINLELCEPLYKSCVHCGKTRHLKGELIHLPSLEYKDRMTYMLPDGTVMEPFSFWVYRCAWCRGVTTRRAKYRARNLKLGEQSMLYLPGGKGSARCDCGGNVFTKINVRDNGEIVYNCNSCGDSWIGIPHSGDKK